MARTLILALGLLALTPWTAQAQERVEAYYVVQERLTTPYMTNRFTGWGLGVATEELHEMKGERVSVITRSVNRLGGRVLGVTLRELGLNDSDEVEATASGWAIRDGEHKLFRRRGELLVLFAGPADLNRVGPLRDARQVDPQSPVTVWMRAWDRDAEGWTGRVPPAVSVSLREVVALQRSPARAKWTGVGALLRRTWERALGDLEDDPEWLRARVRIQASRLRLTDGETVYWRLEDELSEEDADLILGRELPFKEWVLDKLGRLDEPPTVDEETARLLDRSLSGVQYEGGLDEESWDRLRSLRARDPGDLTAEDRAFLADPRREPTRGLSDRLPGLGD